MDFPVNYLANFWTDIICNWDTGNSRELIAMQYEMLEWLRIMVEAGVLVEPFDAIPEPRPRGAQPPITVELYTRELIRSAILDALSEKNPKLADDHLNEILRKRQDTTVKSHLGRAIHELQELGVHGDDEIRRILIQRLDQPVDAVNTTVLDLHLCDENAITG